MKRLVCHLLEKEKEPASLVDEIVQDLDSGIKKVSVEQTNDVPPSSSEDNKPTPPQNNIPPKKISDKEIRDRVKKELDKQSKDREKKQKDLEKKKKSQMTSLQKKAPKRPKKGKKKTSSKERVSSNQDRKNAPTPRYVAVYDRLYYLNLPPSNDNTCIPITAIGCKGILDYISRYDYTIFSPLNVNNNCDINMKNCLSFVNDCMAMGIYYFPIYITNKGIKDIQFILIDFTHKNILENFLKNEAKKYNLDCYINRVNKSFFLSQAGTNTPIEENNLCNVFTFFTNKRGFQIQNPICCLSPIPKTDEELNNRNLKKEICCSISKIEK